jgi:hypothetical protein
MRVNSNFNVIKSEHMSILCIVLLYPLAPPLAHIRILIFVRGYLLYAPALLLAYQLDEIVS